MQPLLLRLSDDAAVCGLVEEPTFVLTGDCVTETEVGVIMGAEERLGVIMGADEEVVGMIMGTDEAAVGVTMGGDISWASEGSPSGVVGVVEDSLMLAY